MFGFEEIGQAEDDHGMLAFGWDKWGHPTFTHIQCFTYYWQYSVRYFPYYPEIIQTLIIKPEK
ncbi:hypothetical protein [Peribacillus frigoritolerans]|uniref:hypothetical protein n=1 Tax=Peribacillus frigoritolerans TaxID=450367 RepID=UPI001F4F96EF|nr:hypothetical protein [Peribacillus frigoritolerans]MCK2020670.1 hypothetical protein [Peribacillus frigoritolerans]